MDVWLGTRKTLDCSVSVLQCDRQRNRIRKKGVDVSQQDAGILTGFPSLTGVRCLGGR